MLKENGRAVCLIKPQFEAGREKVGKKGVVRDRSVHIAVIEKIKSLVAENRFSLLGLDFSPVKGPEGNIEYLCYLQKSDSPAVCCPADAARLVEESYLALKGEGP